MTSSSAPTDPSGPTGQLSEWVQAVKLEDVPPEVATRAKYIILDGIACLIVGAHLPWSEKAVQAILEFSDKPGCGPAHVYGWDSAITPMQAALLNSSFIQGFELDDWHSEAPLHSNSLLLPSLLATVESEAAANNVAVSGKDFLLSAIVGYEVGPRVGLALWGGHILSAGWHSGAVFGPSAVASAVSKMLHLPANQIEDALGIACTQACGLMSAQFGSEAKRMQHGFAARNGLLGTFLARKGYTGIKTVFEQPYGGFLTQFSAGNGKTPNFRLDEVSKELGSTWKTKGVRMKPYAAMAATHPTVDCVRQLQEKYPQSTSAESLKAVKSIVIEMGSDAFHHGGWQATRPLPPLGAQMSCTYVAATQFVDSQVLVAQFEPDMLDRDNVWDLTLKTKCVQNDDLDKDSGHFAQRMTVEYEPTSGLEPIVGQVQNARGVDPELSNEELVEKFRELTERVVGKDKSKKIEDIILNMESCDDVNKTLVELLVKF